jgi:lipopolysaccharide export system permease protein
MIKLIDRQLIRGYFKAYAVCLTSLLSLYVVVDLFTNLDDFATGGVVAAAKRIGTYYGYRITKIFDLLCEAIILLAAMFTVAWMQRNNEQLPLLSAGVSTRRIVAPVLVSACMMLSLAVLNQELVIPRVGDKLNNPKNDPDGEKEVGVVHGAYEPNGIHIEGGVASRKALTVKPFRCLIPASLAGTLIHLNAAEAHYIAHGQRQGVWELTGVTQAGAPAEITSVDPKVLEFVDKGRYLLHTREVDFDALTRQPNWYLFASTTRLYQELQKPDTNRQVQVAMAVLFHMRMTRPLLGILLVVMGLAMILRDQNRNVILSTGGCLVLCGVFFAMIQACKMLGEHDILSPALAAWCPVILFGPFAFVLFDSVHT